MNLTIKRHLISLAETFSAGFIAVFLLQIETVINSGGLPTKEVLIASIIAGTVAGAKSIIKVIREWYSIKK